MSFSASSDSSSIAVPIFFFSSRRRHTRLQGDWSSDVCSSDLAKTVQELLAQARAQPGKLAYGSNGAGTGQHLIGAQFESMGGVQLLHVPYKGSGPLTTDLLGGQIAMSFDTVTPVLPHIKAGKLRALARS